MKILSARGSRSRPSSDSWPRRRAMYPSKKSVHALAPYTITAASSRPLMKR
jgi:hypothetical protein